MDPPARPTGTSTGAPVHDPAWIDGFDARFAAGVPSLTACESLRIAGDVAFGRGVRCRGDVSIGNESNRQAMIDADAVLEGTVTL